MSGPWFTALGTGALLGAVITPFLSAYGLRRLVGGLPAVRSFLPISTISGCVAGVAAVAASGHAGGWWVAPAYLLWACALAAAATCDALTQRVPTSLVRQSGVATAVLLVAGLSARHDWRGLAISGAAATIGGLLFLLLWRLAGLGLGDVRLAVLGGLGLGHASLRGVEIGIGALCALILVQAMLALAWTRNRRTMLPFGPALALGFVLAATI